MIVIFKHRLDKVVVVEEHSYINVRTDVSNKHYIVVLNNNGDKYTINPGGEINIIGRYYIIKELIVDCIHYWLESVRETVKMLQGEDELPHCKLIYESSTRSTFSTDCDICFDMYMMRKKYKLLLKERTTKEVLDV